MKILAIDTSSKRCTVCISENEEVLIQLNSDDETTHSQKLMPIINEAFNKINLYLENIDLLATSLGPGSFTGVRIGISTIKAFADVKHIPVVGVSSLEGLAYNLNKNGLICSIIDAKNDNVYYGLFEFSNNVCNKCITISSDNIKNLLSTLSTFSSSYNSISFVGDGLNMYKELINDQLKNIFENIFYATDFQNLACGISIAKSAYNKYKNGEYGDSNILSPLYLRKSQAERALDEKNG